MSGCLICGTTLGLTDASKLRIKFSWISINSVFLDVPRRLKTVPSADSPRGDQAILPRDGQIRSSCQIFSWLAFGLIRWYKAIAKCGDLNSSIYVFKYPCFEMIFLISNPIWSNKIISQNPRVYYNKSKSFCLWSFLSIFIIFND